MELLTRKQLSLMLLSFVCVCQFQFAGCQTRPVGEREGESILENLEATYEGQLARNFLDYVSDDYQQGKLKLRESLEKEFRDFSSLDLLLWVDHTVSSEEKTVFQTHWKKRKLDNHTGKWVQDRGNCEFVFTRSAEPKLFQITGDSPFG